MEFSHYSVMLKETIEELKVKSDGIYVDGTLGGGGHAYEVCKRLSDAGHFYGIDQDAAAIAAASQRLSEFGDRVTIIRSNYCEMCKELRDRKGRQKGGCGKSRRNLPHDQVGRYARRPRTTIRHDGIEALFAQRYQIDHDPAARTQAPGPLNKRTSRNRAGYEAGKPRTSRRTDCRPDFYGPPPNFGRVYTFKYRDRFPAYFNSRLRSHADPVNSYAPKHPRKKFRGKVEPIGR